MRRSYWLLSLLIVAILLAGCGTVPTQVAQQDSGFVLALPRLTIDLDSQGVPSVAGIDPQTLKAVTFGQLDLTQFQVPTTYVDWFTTTNVQNIELMHREDGLYVFVNGQQLPHLGWSGTSLTNLGDVAGETGLLNPNMTRLIELLIPFIQRTGLNVAVRFPRQAGAAEIPMVDLNAPLAQPTSDEAGTMAVVHVTVSFSEDGVPSVLSVSTRDLQEALGYNLRQLELAPSTVQSMMNMDIQHVTVRTMTDGVFIWVNDKPLPNLAWSDSALTSAADLYGQLYYTDDYAPIREAVSVLLPILNNLDAQVVLQFPVASGAAVIPLPN